MMTSLSYYSILEIENSATESEIRKAYRRLALRYHPDKSSDPVSLEKFKQIAEAYQVLSDDKSRDDYDRFGAIGAHDSSGSKLVDAAQLFLEIFGSGFLFNAVNLNTTAKALFNETDKFQSSDPFMGMSASMFTTFATFRSNSAGSNSIKSIFVQRGHGHETSTITLLEDGKKTVTVTENGYVTMQLGNGVQQLFPSAASPRSRSENPSLYEEYVLGSKDSEDFKPEIFKHSALLDNFGFAAEAGAHNFAATERLENDALRSRLGRSNRTKY